MMANTLVKTYDGGRLEVTAGRVTTIDLGASVLDVLSDPSGGNVTVNSDGTLALVLPDPDQRGDLSFAVRVGGPGGPREVSVALRAAAGPEESGWGAGDHYTLATDADDRTVVEVGENHRKVYVSGGKDALSLADIAAREGLKTGQIDAEWLAAHPEYGGSEGMALDVEAGMKLWNEISGHRAGPSSHWLLFERGHEYDGTKRLVESGTVGESGIHPVVIGAWGTGEKPVIADEWSFTQKVSKHIVIRDLDFAAGGSIVGSAENVILEDVILRDASTSIRGAEGITLRNSQILDVADSNKTNGLYVEKSAGILIENVLADHNGWGRGVTPNAFNHNFYIQWNNLDVTFRDNVAMRGSSFGAQIRSGGVVEDNAFLDNNIALNVKGGVGRGTYHGNYSLILDNVVSSGAHKDAPKIGALSWGVQNLAHETSLIGNIIAHLADPADREERAEKTEAPKEPLKHKFDPFVDDTVIYNWVTDDKRGHHHFLTDRNVPDIDEAILDEVTLRRFIERVTGGKNPGDVIDTLSGWLRENWSEIEGGAEIVRFFQDGFGLDTAERTRPADLRFVPDARGDGMRWDNRLNWSTEDGPIDGDRVDLAGNWVTYSGTVELAALDLGAGGALTLRQGRLDVAEVETGVGSTVKVGLAGQIWIDGYDDGEVLAVEVAGGRFANTGAFTGPVDLSVSGGEALLATDGARFTLDGRLAVAGSEAKVGFDGKGGAAVLALAAGAELAFAPDAGGVSTIREFTSGAWGPAASAVVSTIDLGDGDTTLVLDLGALKPGGRMVLAEADTIIGEFGDIEVVNGGKTAVTVVIDYAEDRVELVTASGGGDPVLEFVGSPGGGDRDPAPVGPRPVPEPEPQPEPEPGTGGVDAKDDSATTAAGKAVRIHVLGNDAGDVWIDGFGDAENGSVSKAGGGRLVYTPNPGFGGTDSFTYTAVDGAATDTATVRVEVVGGTSRLAPKPKPEPQPAAEADWNQITGTQGFDVLRGTGRADLIRSDGGGYDRIWGGDGADGFVFGAGARDGVRASDQIFDFDPVEDLLVLEAGAEIARAVERDDSLRLTLKGDSDLILVGGEGIALDTVQIIQTDDIWIG